MKVVNSSKITPFGGLNFVLFEFEKNGIGRLINQHLPALASQSQYSWKDIFYSFWSVLFCGGDCAEDLSVNFKPSFGNNPFMRLPSPDRVLERMKELAGKKKVCTTKRGKSTHEFCINDSLNLLNIKLLKRIGELNNKTLKTLDYDNTIIFSDKADARNTYLKQHGYAPGVGFIGKKVVYLENRNGNSDAQTLQQDTLRRMFSILKHQGILIDKFRADGASCQLTTLSVIADNVNKFYIRARMNETLAEIICKIVDWNKVIIDGQETFRASVNFTPFEKIAKRLKQENLLVQCRLVVTKQKRADRQVNLFTGEDYFYRAILTNDLKMSNDQVVNFYNQRGAIEREFDVLKNDFSWNKMPFSHIEQNTVFLIITAICRNLYEFIINSFSKLYANLSPSFRLKKFIFRFICIPAKWIKSARGQKLRIYGQLHFKT
ncbi:MAG: IS1380 family transposase [Bacteroidales bacterium]|nr:IS1380 family transposase [Bacteroidales bacterium]